MGDTALQRLARSRHRRTWPAFTLIEVLVAIGIIGILIAIIAPALRGARDSARETVCLANLRTCHTDMQAYLEAEGQYPFLPAHEPIDTSPDGDGSEGILTDSHWATSLHWTSALREVAPWRPHFESWVCPGAPRAPGRPWAHDPSVPESQRRGSASYIMSHAFRAGPGLWAPKPPTDPDALREFLRPVQAHEVRAPAAKALFYDHEMAHLDPLATAAERDARPVGFADGHAAIRRLSESADPVPNPLAGGVARRLHDTPRGVRGRDY